MSTFYVLPSRPRLGDHIAAFLNQWFPGLTWGRAKRVELAEKLGALASKQEDVYVVFAEDLPEGMDLHEALTTYFGAAAGDEVIEVSSARSNRWRVAA